MRKHGGLICDLGNVIVAYWLSAISRATFSTIDYNRIPEVPGAFDGLRLFSQLYDKNITVCYNATDIAQEKISGWLAYHDFSNRTGIPIDHVVHSSGGRNKTSCIDQSSATCYGTTVVIDDRLETLKHFIGRVATLFLFRPQADEVERFGSKGELAHVCVVQTWEEILRATKG